MSATASQIVDTEFGSYKSEVRDGMRIDWDVPIRTDDEVVLRADVYRPIADGRYPALMNYGPYSKGLPFQVGYAAQWQALERDHPDVREGSSGSIKLGRRPIRKSGSPKATPAYASIRAARDARKATSIASVRARPRTILSALNGRHASPGATGRSAFAGSPTMR